MKVWYSTEPLRQISMGATVSKKAIRASGQGGRLPLSSNVPSSSNGSKWTQMFPAELSCQSVFRLRCQDESEALLHDEQCVVYCR